MGEILNPFFGPVQIRVKTYASGNNPVTGNAASWTGWTALEYNYQNRDGLVMEYEGEMEDDVVAGYTAPVQSVIVGETLNINVQIKKATLEQVAKFGHPGATFDEGATPGTNPDLMTLGGRIFPAEFSVGLQGFAPSGQALVMFVPKMQAAASRSDTFKKGSTFVPFNWRALADTSEAAGSQLARFYEITESE